MFSVFDIDQLQSLLQDFYRIAHIRITVFDDRMRELVSWPPEVAPCCAVIRETPAGAAACVACDRQACADALSRREEVHIYRCHAGLTEAVAPLYVGNLIAGYLLFGHVFSYSTPEEGWRVIAVSPNIAMGYGLVITFEKQDYSHAVPSGGFGI